MKMDKRFQEGNGFFEALWVIGKTRLPRSSGFLCPSVSSMLNPGGIAEAAKVRSGGRGGAWLAGEKSEVKGQMSGAVRTWVTVGREVGRR